LTDSLWKEQSRCKSLETELSDLRLHIKSIDQAHSDLLQQLEREKTANLAALERTRTEVERMRERQEREQRDKEERLINGMQREIGHYKGLSEELERQNRQLQ
jgi:predicted  nucleic acid-binding Zn-ribbon protein